MKSTPVSWGSRVGAVIGLLVLPAVLAGQTGGLSASEDTSACLASIPSSAMKPVVVVTVVDVVTPKDSSAQMILPPARALSRKAAWHVRNLLGAPDVGYPLAEPIVTWRGAQGRLRVTSHRSGKLDWASHDPNLTGARGDGVALLASGLDDAVRAGFTFDWPTGVVSDSIVFDLHLVSATHDREGVESPLRVEAPEPVFAVMMPWQQPAMQTGRNRMRYPSGLQGKGVSGFLRMTFVVDTSGRAEMETVADIWPSDRPRLVGELGAYYDALLSVVRNGLRSARFQPARIGGCAVRMWVEQAFEFKLGR